MNGQVAGVSSAGFAFDLDLDSDFGDNAIWTRVSRYAGWIDFQMSYASLPVFKIDMGAQPAGNDGLDDLIDIARNGDWIDVHINGDLAFTDLARNLPSLLIVGSGDNDTVTVHASVATSVTFVAFESGDIDELVVHGSDGYDGVELTNNRVKIGRLVVQHAGIQRLSVHSYGGADDFFVTMSGAGQPSVTLHGGGEADDFYVYGTGHAWVHLEGGGGADTFALGNPGLSLDGVTRVSADGGDGADVMILNDSGDLNQNTYELHSWGVKRNSNQGTFEYESVATLTVYGGQKLDTFLILSTTSATATTIDGGGGDDDFSLRPDNGGLAAIGTLTLRGGAGVNSLTLSDHGNAYPSDLSGIYTISGSAVTRNERYASAKGTLVWQAVNIGYHSFATLTFHAGTGDDLVRITGNSALYRVYGGLGNDILVGGAGADFLHGGVTEITYDEDTGRDIIIGGLGADAIHGGKGEDILIGGSYALAHDNARLIGLRGKWTRSDLPYASRVSLLRSDLKSATVIDDATIDAIWGGDDLDWFWGTWSLKLGAADVRDRTQVESIN